MSQTIAGSFLDVFKTASTELGFMRHANDPMNSSVSLPKDIQADKAASAHKSSGCKSSSCSDSHKPDSIFESARKGNISAVQAALAKEGEEVVLTTERDGTVLHWAALSGNPALVIFLLEVGDRLRSARELVLTVNTLGHTVLHWAAVEGSVEVMDVLLEVASDSVDIQDYKGCTLLITAAQYGKTEMAGYLMSKGVQISICDNEGDSALHWAAFKATADLVRLMVFSGLNPHQRDNCGQTPLHLACIAGNLNIVRDFCLRDKVAVNVPDNFSKTPLMLAAGRKNFDVVDFLKTEINRRSSKFNSFNIGALFYGQPGNSTRPLLFFLFSILFWGYPYYALQIYPLTWNIVPQVHRAFLISNILFWFVFYKSWKKDPGFLPKNTPEYEAVMSRLGEFTDWRTKGSTPLTYLCHTCRLIRPHRAKHCRVCDRCILQFDHHCPYIHNCVGFNNRHWFAYLLAAISTLAGISSYLLYITWSLIPATNIAFVVSIILAFIGVVISWLTSSCIFYHMIQNITTTESVKWRQYPYMKTSGGRFMNPFNQGWWRNILTYFHVRQSPIQTLEPEILVMPSKIVHC